MNATASLRSYVESIMNCIQGTKILLLDDETTKIIGLIYSKTELLSQDVVLIESISQVINKPVDEALKTIQCVCILKPTHEIIRALSNELNTPHYGSYNLFFTNVLSQGFLTQLAFADHSRKVVVVHEIFLYGYALNRRLFSLGIPTCINALKSNIDDPKLPEIVDGIFSMLCALKLKCDIRYDRKSSISKRVSEKLRSLIDMRQEYFISGESDSRALLLILDRRSDAITPMLHHWGYAEILHEGLTIDNNVVTLNDGSSKQLVVDERTDDFWAEHLFHSFPDVNNAIQDLGKQLGKIPNPTEIKNFDDLKSFIQNFPVAKGRQEKYSKHLSLLSAANSAFNSEAVIARTGAIEQEIAVDNDPRVVNQIIQEMEHGNFNVINRLATLYCLKFEKSQNNIELLRQKLGEFPRGDVILNNIDRILQFAGSSYSNRDFSVVNQFVSRFSGLIGQMTNEENSLMRYHAPIESILKNIREGNLSSEEFPGCPEMQMRPYQRAIVFYIGGATYTEAKAADAASTTTGNKFDVVVGGTFVHNFKSFLNECTN